MRRAHAKPLYSLLLSAFTGASGAVNLGGDGTGQALIYPYYTVRAAGPGDWATYLNVVNHTGDAKALRLRFREGKNGRSVFDMNLYLGAGDVWAGAVSKTANGAQLMSADSSCVTASGSLAQSVAAGKLSPAFSNAMYVGASTTQGVFDGYDGEDMSFDRTREGFFEIIEMGVVTDTAILNGLKHGESGVPANCGVVASIDAGAVGAPRGGISGGASLIHVLKGADVGYEPVVLEDFYRAPTAKDNLWTAPGNRLPDLSQATPVSRIFHLHQPATTDRAGRAGTDILETAWDRGIDAVSAVLMHSRVKNAFVLDAATQSSTDWIITMPTKHYYISANAPGTSVPNDPDGTQRLSPFHSFFWSGGSCDRPHSFQTWNREGATPFLGLCTVGCPHFVVSSCWVANVGSFKPWTASTRSDEEYLLGSKARMSVAYGIPNGISVGVTLPEDYFGVFPSYENGWAEIILSTNPEPIVGKTLSDQKPETHWGTPAVGFMVQDFINHGVSINGLPSASSYGGSFKHKYTSFVTGGNVAPD